MVKEETLVTLVQGNTKAIQQLTNAVTNLNTFVLKIETKYEEFSKKMIRIETLMGVLVTLTGGILLTLITKL